MLQPKVKTENISIEYEPIRFGDTSRTRVTIKDLNGIRTIRLCRHFPADPYDDEFKLNIKEASDLIEILKTAVST